MRHLLCLSLLLVFTGVAAADETGFVKIFDGKSMENWKLAEENTDAWHVEDGKLVCDGSRCHLFYDGPLAPLKDFHFKAEVMTTPGSNAGIYFHTKYQGEGWPKFGYECQVNVSHKDPKKTSSLYGVVNVSAEDLAKERHQGQRVVHPRNHRHRPTHSADRQRQDDGGLHRTGIQRRIQQGL